MGSVKQSPDLGDYATGKKTAAQTRCALCGKAPCACPAFGAPEYFALVDRVHGK